MQLPKINISWLRETVSGEAGTGRHVVARRRIAAAAFRMGEPLQAATLALSEPQPSLLLSGDGKVCTAIGFGVSRNFFGEIAGARLALHPVLRLLGARLGSFRGEGAPGRVE